MPETGAVETGLRLILLLSWGMRDCTSCGQAKPLAQFYRNKRYPANPRHWPGYDARCKGCVMRQIKATRKMQWNALFPGHASLKEALRVEQRRCASCGGSKAAREFYRTFPVSEMAVDCRTCRRKKTYREHYKRYGQSYQKSPQGRNSARRVKQVRRAREAGALVEKVDPNEVFRADGGICWICEWPVSLAAPLNRPESAQVDHVIPLALGGLHERRNCRTSHKFCNGAKGARLATPALLLRIREEARRHAGIIRLAMPSSE